VKCPTVSFPNHDHNYYAISDQVNAKVWEFLKSVHLESAGNASQP
jgi:hypothetical protein